jgi:hypothetical protein
MSDPTLGSDLEQAILDNAQGPARAQGDSGSVQQHPLPDQIEADRYLCAKKAVKNGLGIKMTRLIPPGTTG